MKKKTFVIALCLALVVAFAAGGAIAWLTDKTASVTNTFTVGNIDITLTETTTDFKMIPGNTIAKDPKVTVKAGSEACWLFVKIDESANLGDYISYTVDIGATAWSKGDGTSIPTNVYYRSVDATTAAAGIIYSVLAGDEVTVKNTVTKEQMDAITAAPATAPTLTFTAYAVQAAGFSSAEEAWTKTKPAG